MAGDLSRGNLSYVNFHVKMVDGLGAPENVGKKGHVGKLPAAIVGLIPIRAERLVGVKQVRVCLHDNIISVYITCLMKFESAPLIVSTCFNVIEQNI